MVELDMAELLRRSHARPLTARRNGNRRNSLSWIGNPSPRSRLTGRGRRQSAPRSSASLNVSGGQGWVRWKREAGQITLAALDGLRFVDDFEDALRAGAGILDDVGELADHADAMADGHQIEHNFGQVADRQVAPNDLSAADP